MSELEKIQNAVKMILAKFPMAGVWKYIWEHVSECKRIAGTLQGAKHTRSTHSSVAT